jgi:hypothetical protein
MSEANETTGREQPPAAEVDRIRDIIFGPQMRNYDKQFKRMANQLDLIGKQVQELRAAFDQQLSTEEARTREFQEAIGQRQTDLEKTIAGRLGNLEAGYERQQADLAAQMRQLATEMRSEFTTALNAMEDDTANRHDLGDLLIEMGTRLKEQMGLADLLGQLGEAAQDPSTE